MAGVKISELPAATTPLAGTELLAIVQGGVTKQASADAVSDAVLDEFAASSGSSLVGFLQSGTGASSRTVQSKLRDVVSVTDFNAVGDGVTDDTAAIQAALTAAGTASNSTVFFPRGTYLVTSQLTITGTRISLVGSGKWASTITNGVVGNPANSLFLVGATNDYVLFDGLRVVGNGLTGASGNGHAISAIGTSADYVSFLWVRNCEFLSLAGNGKDSTGASMSAAGVYVFDGLGVHIEDNYFASMPYGIVLSATAPSSTNKVNISGNNFESITSIGIKADSAENLVVDRMNVFNNIGSGSAGDGGIVLKAFDTVVITGNRFKNINGNHVAANTSTYANNLSVKNNYFYTFFATPIIDIGTAVQSASVQENELQFDASVTSAQGILISNPAGYVGYSFKITGNRAFVGGGGTVTDVIKINNGTNPIRSLTIDNNFFGQQTAPSAAQVITNGINLAGAGGIQSSRINGNSFAMVSPGTFTNGIVVGSGCTGTLIENNSYSNVATPVSDSGAKTTQIALGVAAYGGAQSIKKTSITWAVTMNIDASLGNAFLIVGTNATPVTVASPTNPVDGQRISFTIKNTSGGAINLSWGAAYKLATWTSPATGNNRAIDFVYDSGSAVWYEVSRTPADVPN